MIYLLFVSKCLSMGFDRKSPRPNDVDIYLKSLLHILGEILYNSETCLKFFYN